MKAIIACLAFLLSYVTSVAQADLHRERIDVITDSIYHEGYWLYRSEMASWFGTDIFVEKHKDMSNVGGYFSYSENDTSRCIFYSKGDTAHVLGMMSFDTSYNINAARVDLVERSFSKKEYELYSLRIAAQEAIKGDTLFKIYARLRLNLVPLVSNGVRKVYILSGPEDAGVVVIGNDYLLSFDANDNVVSKRRLHKNILRMAYGANADSTKVPVVTMHTHVPETGDFITATDICTLLLYAPFAKWSQHYVISANYVSLWDCKSRSLVILTSKAWKRIAEDQEKRHPQKQVGN